MERKKYGFTMIELLTVIGIIALLVGLLIPALNMVNTMAKEAKQKAQITAIELALTAFRNDYGDYPESSWNTDSAVTREPGKYCGAQKLAEALLGWDLMGFHPKSAWMSDGGNKAGPIPLVYEQPPSKQNLDERRGPYLELGSANAYRVGINPATGMKDGLFNDPAPLAPNPYVICDAFGVKRITLTLPNNQTERFLAGTPILYYRANTLSKTLDRTLGTQNLIYNVYDNMPFINTQQFPQLKPLNKGVNSHRLGHIAGTYENFYRYIADPKITTTPWPYRPDSYILISAGADGEYGTADDITNF